MNSPKPRGRIAKRMAFYARIRKNSLGKMILRDLRSKVAPLFSKDGHHQRVGGSPFVRDEWDTQSLDIYKLPGTFV